MKRANNLMQHVVDPDNLRLAFWKASKGKRYSHEVNFFRSELDFNLFRLRSEIIEGTLEPGEYRCFTIKDPKERTICAAPFKDRVLHHGLMNICHPIFEKFQIYHSYASRKGKGTYRAIEQAYKNQGQYDWYVKLDVKKHFESIDHHLLINQISRIFKEKAIINLFEKIIFSYSASEGKGLPIGNLTSQYFANHYLGFGDHFLYQQLKVPAYIRYMDDMVIWSNSKIELNLMIARFQKFINDDLLLRLKPVCLNKTSKGLPYCGYVIYPNKINLNSRSRKRYNNKLKIYSELLKNGYWTQKDFNVHMLPLIAFTRHANALNFRKKCLGNLKIGND